MWGLAVQPVKSCCSPSPKNFSVNRWLSKEASHVSILQPQRRTNERVQKVWNRVDHTRIMQAVETSIWERGGASFDDGEERENSGEKAQKLKKVSSMMNDRRKQPKRERNRLVKLKTKMRLRITARAFVSSWKPNLEIVIWLRFFLVQRANRRESSARQTKREGRKRKSEYKAYLMTSGDMPLAAVVPRSCLRVVPTATLMAHRCGLQGRCWPMRREIDLYTSKNIQWIGLLHQ